MTDKELRVKVNENAKRVAYEEGKMAMGDGLKFDRNPYREIYIDFAGDWENGWRDAARSATS